MLSKKSIIYCILLFLFSCSKDSKQKEHTAHYIFISHILSNNNEYHFQIELDSLNLNGYDMTLLGGDLLTSTSSSWKGMRFLDSVFNLSSPNTLWSIGNHDNSSPENIKIITKKNLNYSYIKNNIGFVVLNTQENNGSISQKQIDIIEKLKESNISYMIIMHHKLIWMPENDSLEQMIPKISNALIGPDSCGYCLHKNNFYSELYPKLIKIKNKGINVICLGGDSGLYSKFFQYITPEGIIFLASGLMEGVPNNKAIKFTHYIEKDSLKWEAIPISKIQNALKHY